MDDVREIGGVVGVWMVRDVNSSRQGTEGRGLLLSCGDVGFIG